MQYGTDGLTWAEWLEANDDRDDPTKLLALREYIVAVAKRWVNTCTYDARWANKKLAKLGITDRLPTREVAYVLAADVTGSLDLTVYASNRTDAMDKAVERLTSNGADYVRNIRAVGAPTFVSGPEDDDPDAVADDAPTTVDGTLARLREIILLGHIAGPRICKEEADDVLKDFGLAPIPPRKTFVVTRPVDAVMRTTVEAYDEESAQRVAGWRWDNNRSGYETTDAQPTGDATVLADAAPVGN